MEVEVTSIALSGQSKHDLFIIILNFLCLVAFAIGKVPWQDRGKVMVTVQINNKVNDYI